jgi:hypothetical protein
MIVVERAIDRRKRECAVKNAWRGVSSLLADGCAQTRARQPVCVTVANNPSTCRDEGRASKRSGGATERNA